MTVHLPACRWLPPSLAGCVLAILLLAVKPEAAAVNLQPGAERVLAAPVDVGLLAARLYASGTPPRWLDDGQAQARLALQLLMDASAHGLDSRHYGAEALTRRLENLHGDTTGFERDLSTAMLQFLADLHQGRTRSPYRPAGGTSGGLDLVEHLRDAVISARLAQPVEAAAPALPLYWRVKETLARYHELASLVPQWQSLPPAVGAGITAGGPYAGAALLRQRLQLLGDLAPDAVTGDERVNDAMLAGAVRRFQSRHGLAEDGVLGPETIAALSVPPARRAEQLALTMERLRWLPP